MRVGFVCIIGLTLASLLEVPPSRSGKWGVVNITYQQAQPILEVLDGDLPAELKNRSPAELEAAWPGWVARHGQEIRARLIRGEEDTLVNFLTFGTSYTTQPRLTPVEFKGLRLNQVPSQLSPDSSPAATLFLIGSMTCCGAWRTQGITKDCFSLPSSWKSRAIILEKRTGFVLTCRSELA